MFLGQSHDASAKSQERSIEPSVHLLRRSAPHKGIDADNERDTRNISGNYKRSKKRRAQSDAPYRNCVCSATTGQAVGPTCNQQGSQTRSAAQCRVYSSRRKAAGEFCRPSSSDSILATAIRLA